MKKIFNILVSLLQKNYLPYIPRYIFLRKTLGTSGQRNLPRNLALSLFLFNFINLKCEENISTEEPQNLSVNIITNTVTKCANCQHCQNNNNNTSLNQPDPTPAIVLTNFAQMAVHFGNIVGDPKNKPVVQQNVCNIMACVANAAAQAFRNLNLQNCDDPQETSEKIYRYLLSLDIDKNY